MYRRNVTPVQFAEALMAGYTQLMVRHSRNHATPLVRSRQVLETAILLYPGNTYFLSQYILGEAGQGLMTRRRQFMDNLLSLYATVDIPITTWLFAIQAEMVMRNPVHSRVVALLERAVANEFAVTAPVIWHAYIRLALGKRLDVPTLFLSPHLKNRTAKDELKLEPVASGVGETLAAAYDGDESTIPRTSPRYVAGMSEKSKLQKDEQVAVEVQLGRDDKTRPEDTALAVNRENAPIHTKQPGQVLSTANDKVVEEVFYRALEACPGSKMLYVHAVSHFGDNSEAWRIAVDLMQEKELRVRTPLEELELL